MPEPTVASLKAQVASLTAQLAERDAQLAAMDAERKALLARLSAVGGDGAPGTPGVSELLVREKMAEEEARRVALVRLQARGGSRKGKLEPAERERVEEFISRVRGGELKVSKGELAKAMRLYVCPSMERSQEFFEKLVSRRGLNKSMGHLLLPRRKHKDSDDDSVRSGKRSRSRRGDTASAHKRHAGGGLDPLASRGLATGLEGSSMYPSHAPLSLGFGGGGMPGAFGGGLHPDPLAFAPGVESSLGPLGAFSAGIGGALQGPGPGMGLRPPMSLGVTAGMAAPPTTLPPPSSLHGFMGRGGGPPSMDPPGLGGPTAPALPHASAPAQGMSASAAAAAASRHLASSLGLGPVEGGGGDGAAETATPAASTPAPASTPAQATAAAAGGSAAPAAKVGSSMKRDWSLESLERLADIASIESGDIDAITNMLGNTAGAGGEKA